MEHLPAITVGNYGIAVPRPHLPINPNNRNSSPNSLNSRPKATFSYIHETCHTPAKPLFDIVDHSTQSARTGFSYTQAPRMCFIN
jgi:hypothetical protein